MKGYRHLIGASITACILGVMANLALAQPGAGEQYGTGPGVTGGYGPAYGMGPGMMGGDPTVSERLHDPYL